MKLLYLLLRQKPGTREGIVMTTSAVGILTNILLAAVKVIIGAAVSSVAIVSEGVNNASDSITSLLTIIGTKLSGKAPTSKHPFGYGRIEYFTGLIISVLILITGGELLVSSVKLIGKPSELSVSVTTLIIIAFSAVVKLLLGIYTVKMGKKADSGSLIAVGVDCRNDSLMSVVTIASAVIFLVFHFSVDAYAGIIMSAFVLKSGFDVLSGTVGDLLGTPADSELAKKLYRDIRSTPEVLNAADMMLHNYGPDKYSGSVNIEIDHEKTIGEIYAIIHALQLKIMHDYGVTMVFGMYAVDHDHADSRLLHTEIAEFVRSYDHVISYHALYLPPKSNKIYCDLVVDYDLKDRNELRDEFIAYMNKKHPDSEIELTIETEFV